jgi:hypothetical protein
MLVSDALSPPLLTAAALALVGTGTESRTFRGRLTEVMLRQVGQLNRGPWSAAFVHHVGYWSHFNPEGQHSVWPLPATNDPECLAEFGAERRICEPDPELGDVVLLWSHEARLHVRAGIVIGLGPRVLHRDPRRTTWICTTVEGDTNESGAFTGGGVHLLRRRICVARGDLFLRWTSLDARDLPSDPTRAATVEGGRLVVLRTA